MTNINLEFLFNDYADASTMGSIAWDSFLHNSQVEVENKVSILQQKTRWFCLCELDFLVSREPNKSVCIFYHWTHMERMDLRYDLTIGR